MPLEKLESKDIHDDETLVDSDVREKWIMPKRTCLPRNNHEKKIESFDNNKHKARFDDFSEDEEIEDESVDDFDTTHQKYLEVEMCNKRLQEEPKISHDEVIKSSKDLTSK